MQIPLEEYLRNNNDKGVIDHSVRVCFYKMPDGPDRIGFYIHPQDVDGDTLDFIVDRSTTIPAYVLQELFEGFKTKKRNKQKGAADNDPLVEEYEAKFQYLKNKELSAELKEAREIISNLMSDFSKTKFNYEREVRNKAEQFLDKTKDFNGRKGIKK